MSGWHPLSPEEQTRHLVDRGVSDDEIRRQLTPWLDRMSNDEYHAWEALLASLRRQSFELSRDNILRVRRQLTNPLTGRPPTERELAAALRTEDYTLLRARRKHHLVLRGGGWPEK